MKVETAIPVEVTPAEASDDAQATTDFLAQWILDARRRRAERERAIAEAA